MGPGTDVAIKSADITLVKGDLPGIARTEAQPGSTSNQAEALLSIRLQRRRCQDVRPRFCHY